MTNQQDEKLKINFMWPKLAGLTRMILDIYFSHRCPESKSHNYTPRLFELSSATGEFTANEVLFSARSNEVEAFPFQQSDLYSAIQPGVCLLFGK